MTGRRVWTRPGGLVLAHNPDGWPLPTENLEAAGSYWTQLWDRTDVWPCHWTRGKTTCQQLAEWRTVQPCGYAVWRTFWCDRHLPHPKPPDPPRRTCVVCAGPLTAGGETTHPSCVSDDGTVNFDDAIATITSAFAEVTA